MKKSNFANQEEQIQKSWEQNNIFEKTLEKDSPKGDFVFFEGPPTANGKPGLHHVLARAFKDLIPRYKTMQGYKVLRKSGWDTHGLPVELQVEKQLGISGKQDIEKLKPTIKESIEHFNQLCKKSVFEYKEDWEQLSKRIAFWLDYENPYITYDSKYIESLWWIIKQVWDKDLLYQGFKVVPYCPRCGTPLSSHEVSQGYKEIEENSVFLKFKLKDQENTYILSWTTTPWTLPGNVALAVGPELDYVKIKKGNDIYYLAQALLEKVFEEKDYKVLENLKGKDLLNLEYEPLFPGVIPNDVKNFENAYKVYPADFVTIEDGTGVVHTAVMYGEEDYQLGEQIGLPKFHTVNEQGNFGETLKDYGLDNKKVKDPTTEKIIIDYLKEKGYLLKEQMYKHDYPFCWRCEEPLLYYAKPSWFIKMTAVKDDLLKNADDINWVPAHIKTGRFGEWLEGVKDWAFSRERYWGTPLPVWQCDNCENQTCIGSYEDLARLSGIKIDENFDPHRPFIDEVELNCKCGEKMKRVPEVVDVWYDSGSMPFAQWHYPFENKEMVDKNLQYPADYISEAIDQTRGWFYTLLSVSTLLGKGTCYKNVICLGHINDKHGQKMSKSKGNIIDPWYIIDKYSADSLRWHLYTINQPGDSKNFDEQGVDEVIKKLFLILQNVISFYKLYEQEDIKPAADSKNTLDKWVIAKFNLLIQDVSKNLDEYNIISAGREIQDFVTVLSTWYLRRSRDRFKGEDQDDKKQALQTLNYILLELSKVIAPFIPFFAETVYKNLKGEKESVHLEDWPQADEKLINKRIIEHMDVVRKIVEAGLAARAEAGIKIRQPLQSYSTSLAERIDLGLVEIIKEELNIKELGFGKDRLETELTPELIQEGIARELVRNINLERKKQKFTINDNANVLISTDDQNIISAIQKFKDQIQKDTLSTDIKVESFKNGAKAKINNTEVQIKLEKV